MSGSGTTKDENHPHPFLPRRRGRDTEKGKKLTLGEINFLGSDGMGAGERVLASVPASSDLSISGGMSYNVPAISCGIKEG